MPAVTDCSRKPISSPAAVQRPIAHAEEARYPVGVAGLLLAGRGDRVALECGSYALPATW